MSIELDNILNKAETSKKINSIASRNKSLRADIALVAASALVHAAEHGDLTLASKLHNAVSVSFRADIKRYFAAFGPVRYDSKKKAFAKSKKGGAWDIDGALATSFDAVEKAEKPAAEYNRKKELASIVKFLDTKADRAVNAGDADMVAMLVDVAGALAGVIAES